MQEEHKAIKCLKCSDIIVSWSRHDFKRCKCGACFIDGGKDYLRYGGNLEDIEVVDIPEDMTCPKK